MEKLLKLIISSKISLNIKRAKFDFTQHENIEITGNKGLYATNLMSRIYFFKENRVFYNSNIKELNKKLISYKNPKVANKIE